MLPRNPVERKVPIRCLSLSTQDIPDKLGDDILLTQRPGARDTIISQYAPDVLLLDLAPNTPARIATVHDLSPATHIVVLTRPEDAALVLRTLTEVQGVCATTSLDQLPAIIRQAA